MEKITFESYNIHFKDLEGNVIGCFMAILGIKSIDNISKELEMCLNAFTEVFNREYKFNCNLHPEGLIHSYQLEFENHVFRPGLRLIYKIDEEKCKEYLNEVFPKNSELPKDEQEDLDKLLEDLISNELPNLLMTNAAYYSGFVMHSIMQNYEVSKGN